LRFLSKFTFSELTRFIEAEEHDQVHEMVVDELDRLLDALGESVSLHRLYRRCKALPGISGRDR
jgi:ATP-dependent helicase/DNAse subunit B